MKLGELYEALSYGELNNLSIGLEGSGDIAEYDRPRIISYTNRALTRIYGRFSHKLDYVNVTLQDGIQRYWLNPVHTVSDVDVDNLAVRYITDTVEEPFTGGLLKVRGVRNEAEDYERFREININDLSCPSGVMMLNYDLMFIKEPIADVVLTVEYLKKHDTISADASEDTEISIHPFLEEALVFHVAARVISSIGGEENTMQGQRLFGEYERVCQIAEAEDMMQRSYQDSNEKLEIRGFI